jgi:hypothetical protein
MSVSLNAEWLDLYREALGASLRAEPKQAFENLESYIAKMKDADTPRAESLYVKFAAEAQANFVDAQLKGLRSMDGFVETNLRDVRKYAETSPLSDIRFDECRTKTMRLFFRFAQWQRAERGQS